MGALYNKLFSSPVAVTLFDLNQAANIETTKQWDLLTYNLRADFPANDLKFYNPRSIVATGFAIVENRLFLATPRLFSGVPATLSSIPMENKFKDSPILRAYPNWAHHKAGTLQYNCSEIGLVSVYRVIIDSCNRLWALDAGVSRSFEDSEVTCLPKILIFDLKTDRVVRRIDFPREVVKSETLFTNMIIDETTSRPENNCDDAFVYIADTVKPAIVVYDSKHSLTWRVSHPTMYPDPNFAKPNILGHCFTLMDGIVGMAFDAHDKVIYFQPLATDRLFSIKTSALRAGPLSYDAELPVDLVGKKSSQGMGLAVSPMDGSIFFSPLSETAVAKWNPFSNKQSILAYDANRFQFVSDIRISAKDPTSIYVLSSKFHRFFLKNLDSNEINTRLVRVDDVPRKVPTTNAKGKEISVRSTPNLRPHQSPVNVNNGTIENPFSRLVTAYRRMKVPKYRFVRNENYFYVKNMSNFSGKKTNNVS